MPSTGKDSTSAKRGKRFNQCQAREKIQPVPNTGKDLTSAQHGKRFEPYQAREKIQSVPSSGKHTTSARGKREEKDSNGAKCAASVRRHKISTRHGKTFTHLSSTGKRTRLFLIALDGEKTNHVCAD